MGVLCADGFLDVAAEVATPATPGALQPVGLWVRCGGCGKERTFWAPSDHMLDLQVASSGWKFDGRIPRWDCPACWMAYELSVMVAARGNT